MSIPKIIHYCWFGGNEKTPLIRNCIRSWKLFFPDYEIIEWNEGNSSLEHPYLKIVYRQKKWAFVSDYIRLKVLNDYGGVFLDTDMMILKSLDNFLGEECFLGAENETYISAGIIGAKKNHPFIKECLLQYDYLKIRNETNWFEISIPRILTRVFREKYGQKFLLNKKINLKNITIYPAPYFYPLNYKDRGDFKNYERYISDESYAVHLWSGSWIELNEFHYLRIREYSKGFRKIIINIKSNRKITYFYFRKVLSSLKESLYYE